MKILILVLLVLVMIYGEINHWQTKKRLERIESKIDQINCN